MQNPYGSIRKLTAPACTPAQAALQKALIDLLQERPLSELTVKELCRHAFIARSTFYVYYQNTDEILLEIENSLIAALVQQNDQIMNRTLREEEDLQFFTQTLDFIGQNKVLFYTLLVANPDCRFIEKWKDAIKYHLWERLFRDRTANNASLILELAASAVISGYTYWLKHPSEVQVSGICQIISTILKALDYEN